MTVLSLLSLACRLLGFAGWADALWERHVLAVKAKALADTPTTRAELEDTLKKGEL